MDSNTSKERPDAVTEDAQARVIFSPDRPSLGSRPSIFLAGNTCAPGEPDWRETLASSLAEIPIDIFNPWCAEWEGPWNAKLIEWELEMQEIADIIVVFFHSNSLAPISLLELGMCLKSGKAIACALEGYEKRVNVEAVCRRHGVTLVSTEVELHEAVASRLSSMMT